MNIPNPKQIAALAKACRKAGITYFKSADFEFTLDATHKPEPRKKPGSATIPHQQDVQGKVEMDDELSDEQRMFWSVGALPSDDSPQEGGNT